MSRRALASLRRVVAVLLVVAVAVTACGLPNDSAPRAIPVPADLTDNPPPTPTPAIDATLATIWMVGDDDKLVRVTREATRTPEGIMTALLLGPNPDERARGIQTAITRETGYSGEIEVQEFFRRATVDLTEGSLQSNAPGEQRLAFAQIVFSLTELRDEIGSVRFTENGQERAVPIDLAASSVGQYVFRSDYRSVLPDDEPAGPPGVGFVNDEQDEVVEDAINPIAVWMVGATGRLTPVPRPLDPSDQVAVLNNLFLGPTDDEVRRAVSTALPGVANSLEVRADDSGVVTVNLAPGSLPEDLSVQKLAVAQIVHTMTERAGTTGVVIAEGSLAVEVPIDGGFAEPGTVLKREFFFSLTVSAPFSTPTPVPEAEPVDEAEGSLGATGDDPGDPSADGAPEATDGTDGPADAAVSESGDGTDSTDPSEPAEATPTPAFTPEPTPTQVP